MPVRSIQVNAIEARRFSSDTEAKPSQVRVDHNSTVTLVQKVGDQQSVIDFRYTASYGSLGIIKLEGKARFHGPNAGELQQTWESTQQMPQDVASELHTAVMRVCVPEAVFLARDLQLPPPIPLPQVKFDKGGNAGKADTSQGPEVH
ncbi:MAG: hypothetical protein R3185_00565 [Candidatus Thermoplasmatota archaeon]|nr:hypothetical protein [Candidatus Thermoplasmatota archaeon]